MIRTMRMSSGMASSQRGRSMTSRRGGGRESFQTRSNNNMYTYRKSQQPSEGCRRESKGKRGVTADVEKRRNLEVGKTLALRSLAKQLAAAAVSTWLPPSIYLVSTPETAAVVAAVAGGRKDVQQFCSPTICIPSG